MKKISHLESTSCLHVAVGVIKNPNGEILIAQRAANAHQGSLWEFPGGKVETGESAMHALKRELQEEVGINVERSEPLIKIRHDYPDLSVLLDVWRVEKFSGTAHGREGQPIQWVTTQALKNYAFPAANRAIIHAAQLPCFYAILDDGDADTELLIHNLKKILENGIQLIQARLKNLASPAIELFLQQALPLCQQHNAQLLLNSAAANATSHLSTLGLHLTSQNLMAVSERPKTAGWLAASCHNLDQLQHAEKIGVDFAVLAPVLPTQTHPDAETLGWEKFAALVAEVNIPVYALGGLHYGDEEISQSFGGQGIAGIRTFLR